MHRVFGSRISYYTGKVETYLRFRSIDYELLPTEPNRAELLAGAGVVQMPVVQLDDGRWMTDSTPILRWFDSESDGPSIYPEDPAVRFVAILLEDYADEWLWRPAMHYRWSYRHDDNHATNVLVDEITGHIPLPRAAKRVMIQQRQYRGFVRGDGVRAATRAHVEQGYSSALDLMEAIFAERPFLLGDAPTIADFGFMAPMLRHFSQDPTPAEIMRTRAPGVYEWVARMWNLRGKPHTASTGSQADGLVASLLAEVCETHLVQLRENAGAYSRGLKRYDQKIQGCHYERVPASRYRVWCLEELQRDYAALDESDRRSVDALLSEQGPAVLRDKPPAESGYDTERRAPFNRAINVFAKGVPR
ncbi:MAG: glutathione S-transferase family protein [Myxococcota bacterium]